MTREHDELSITQSAKPTVVPNTGYCPPIVGHGQTDNPQGVAFIESDHHSVGNEVTPETKPLHLSEAGVDTVTSGRTEECAAFGDLSTHTASLVQEVEENIFHQGTAFQGNTSTITSTHADSVHTVEVVAELQGNLNGTSGEPQQQSTHQQMTFGNDDPQQHQGEQFLLPQQDIKKPELSLRQQQDLEQQPQSPPYPDFRDPTVCAAPPVQGGEQEIFHDGEQFHGNSKIAPVTHVNSVETVSVAAGLEEGDLNELSKETNIIGESKEQPDHLHMRFGDHDPQKQQMSHQHLQEQLSFPQQEREKSQLLSPQQQRPPLSEPQQEHQEGRRKQPQSIPQQEIEPSVPQQNRQQQETQEVPPRQKKQQLSEQHNLQEGKLLPSQQWALPLQQQQQQHENQHSPPPPQHYVHYEQRPVQQQTQQEQQNVNENQQLPYAKEQQLPQLQQQQLNESHQQTPPKEQQYHQPSLQQQQQFPPSQQIQIIPPKHHYQQYDEEATNQYSGSNNSNGNFQVLPSSLIVQRQDDANCVQVSK